MESSTKILRRMLDERGVEWEDMSIRPYACTSWRDPDGEPCTALEGADDIPDGKLSAQALLTPEQAIAATLGSCSCSDNCTNGERTETCEMEYVSDWMSWHCKSCDHMDMAPRNPKPRYCKWCGRKVVD